jgi:hypothetical protein
MKTLFNIFALVAISASSILANPTGGDDNATNNNKNLLLSVHTVAQVLWIFM